MAKDFQIRYIIEAVDKATATLAKVEKQLKDMDAVRERSARRASVNAAAVLADYKKEQIALSRKRKDYAQFWTEQLNSRDKEVQAQQKARLKSKKIEEQASISKRKSEVEYVDFWKKQLDSKQKAEDKVIQKRIKSENNALQQKIRAEQAAFKMEEQINRQRINQAKREAAARIREEQRVKRARIQSANETYGMSKGMAASITAPTAVNAMFALKNAMTMEQMGIRLRTQFGDEGGKVMEAMKNYALETAFSLQESVRLLNDMKIGASNIGVKSTDQLLSLHKLVGNTLLAFGNSKENREEIANQLGQIAMAGKASNRQDLRVMSRHGLPIYEALEAMTGKKFSQLQDIYGKELPADLIFKAMQYLGKSDRILRAMDERSKSLTQSWEYLGESAFFLSAEYGNLLNKQFKIGQGMRSIGDLMMDVEKSLQNGKNSSNGLLKSSLAFGTAWALTVPIMVVAVSLIQKMALAAGGWSIIASRALLMSGLMSGLYLATVDWQNVIEDIKNEGLAGWLKHLDVIAASFLGILTTVKAIRAAATWIAGATTLGVAGAATGGAAVAAYGGYKAGQAFGESIYADSLLNWFYTMTGEKGKVVDPEIRNRNEARMGAEKANTPVVNVQNNINVDPLTGKARVETKVGHNRDPYRNPVYVHQLGGD